MAHRARDPRTGARRAALRAFALGYLAHLAADAVAHNFFVPRQLAITSSTTARRPQLLGESVRTHLGDRYARRARELLLLDHARADAHLDRILSPTIFSTPTNRRIFRGMVYVTDTESWQRIFQLVPRTAAGICPTPTWALHTRSFDYVVDLLAPWRSREPYAFDPSGDEPLREAKQVRRAGAPARRRCARGARGRPHVRFAGSRARVRPGPARSALSAESRQRATDSPSADRRAPFDLLITCPTSTPWSFVLAERKRCASPASRRTPRRSIAIERAVIADLERVPRAPRSARVGIAVDHQREDLFARHCC